MRDEAARALAVPEILANAARTVGETFFPSRADIVRTNFKVEEQWRRAGGRPTHQPVNGLGNHGGPFNAAVQNQPIVLQGILLDQAFMHMRTNFPTVVEERLQIRFSNLYQEQGEPVRSYYKRVERAGDIGEIGIGWLYSSRDSTRSRETYQRISRHNLNNYKHLSQFVNHRVYRQQIKPVRPKPRPRVVQDHQDPDWNDGYTRDDLELARAMRNLDLNDDAMDIDTNTASFDDLKIVPDEEGGFRIFKMTPIKIPVKVTSSKPTLIKASARKSTEIPEDLVEEKQEEDIREDDPMDIDIARLENTKDLLALDGKVNGIAIQCLADTCANALLFRGKPLKN
ncbi:hypothetical protein GLOIN_2v1790588 [Rhizophagus irregularis DAOM 181602=DAOM 197198]|nr:hypothetical protein GLOIN_2v1790588 [Rhizophagus irregularis DAOM 181602=DAOM 197198]